MAAELRRLFGGTVDVRKLFFGPVEAKGVTVHEDRRHPLEGKDTGVRREKKFWNGFGTKKAGTVLNYELAENGAVSSSVSESSKGQHYYLLDLFQYGIVGLDAKLPGEKETGKKRSGTGSEKPGAGKRHKSDSSIDSEMENVTLSDYIPGGTDLLELERPTSGMVRIVSNMKLYWYDPK